MAIEFTDIELGPVDPTKSFKRAGPWWDTVFFFSSELPPGWEVVFNEVWEAMELPRRHVRIEDGQLVTVCPKRPPEIVDGVQLPPNSDPVTSKDDLESYHMVRLAEAVRRTNALYRIKVSEGVFPQTR